MKKWIPRAVSLFALWGTMDGCGILAEPQQSVPEQVISYQGQTVSSVGLAGHPSLIEAPQLLIAQLAGAPYSQQKIDETVASLKKIGDFQDVKVEVTPETRVRGASLKAGSDYSPRRLERATTLVKVQMAKNHYLASQVQILQPKYDPQANQADVSAVKDFSQLV